jgi:hypothetical protein
MANIDETKDNSPVSVNEDINLENLDLGQAPRIQDMDIPLMDLEKGLVGWDSETDPMNPKYVG